MEVFLSTAIEFGVIFLFGCVGEILTEKSGHLNLGIPGIMCVGAAGGCFGAKLYLMPTENPSGVLTVLIAILFAMIFAGALGAVYGFLTVSLRSNQNVTGLACTIFGVGFTSFFLNNVVLTEGVSTQLSYAGLNFFNAQIPGVESLGWFGSIFLAHGVLVYLAIIVGAAIAGLGGLCYVMDYMGGIVGSTVDQTIQGIGWLSIALVIFTMWRPALAILGSILFGALYIISSRITGISFEQIQLLNMIPFVVTILVLIVTSIIGHRETQPPTSLGLSYFREDR